MSLSMLWTWSSLTILRGNRKWCLCGLFPNYYATPAPIASDQVMIIFVVTSFS